MKPLVAAILFLVLSSASYPPPGNEKFLGFWEGPHPEDTTRNFYIHIADRDDSIIAKGYWTADNFYQSAFTVSQLQIAGDSIRFSIPGWDCVYSGIRTSATGIRGGFECAGEPFDSVQLIKNNGIGTYLIDAKPGCRNSSYRYTYTPPEALGDGLETAGFQSPGDSAFIVSLLPEIIDGKYGRLNSFLVFKNNLLISEEYFFGYSQNDLHQIESCTKSVTSLLIGIAKDRQFITSLAAPIYTLFPDYRQLRTGQYKKITLAHLLSMTSGFDPQNDELFRSANRIDFALKRELIHPPGTTFCYDGGNTEILGAVLKVKTGKFADQFAEDYLFAPLNIENYDWNILKQEGYPCVGGSLRLLPRDMVKIGALIVNHGMMNLRNIVSSDWLKESTAVKTKTHIPGDDYSYQWWNITLHSKGKDYPVIWANGMGSQFIYILPELNVVIVTTGHNYEYDSYAITRGIEKYIYLMDSRR